VEYPGQGGNQNGKSPANRMTATAEGLGYVVCCSPRSGSTLLCEGLAATGRAGMPDELFDLRSDITAYWSERCGATTRPEYFDKVVVATRTRNGVFGTKLHWTALEGLREALCENL